MDISARQKKTANAVTFDANAAVIACTQGFARTPSCSENGRAYAACGIARAGRRIGAADSPRPQI